jgi:serine/threonine protein kinase
MILELLDMSLEERLKGSRQKRRRDDLLAYRMRERLFRVLEYMLPVASAVEYAHLVRNICHRDIKPANILLKLPNPRPARLARSKCARRLQRRQGQADTSTSR